MSAFKGTLVVAGMFAVAGLGCSHYRSTKTYQPSTPPSSVSTESSSTVTTPAAPQQGTPRSETGTGGAGMETQGLPQSSPSTTTTTPNSSTGEPLRDHQDQPIQNNTSINNNLSTQPGTGGSGLDTSKPGLDVKNPDMDPEACNRNQIGSPNSSDVICDQNKDLGTGGSGMSNDMSSSSSSGVSSDTSATSSDLSKSPSDLSKSNSDLDKSKTDLKSSSGTGGAGLDQGNTTTETKTTVKHKKHHKKSEAGTGGSGMTEEKTKTKSKEIKKDTSKDDSYNKDVNSDLNNSDQDTNKVP